MIIIMIISIIIRILRWENHPHTIAYPSRSTFDSLCRKSASYGRRSHNKAILMQCLGVLRPHCSFRQWPPQKKTWIEKYIFFPELFL